MNAVFTYELEILQLRNEEKFTCRKSLKFWQGFSILDQILNISSNWILVASLDTVSLCQKINRQIKHSGLAGKVSTGAVHNLPMV